jgi:hypothetical protein
MSGNPAEDHARVLADRLRVAYEVVKEHNRIRRQKQKIQYDKNTKLVTVAGDYIYLKEMAIEVGKSKKFRDRWRGPFMITKYSNWNYQIQLKLGKIVVNVNRVKRRHNPPSKKGTSKTSVPNSKRLPTGSDFHDDDSDSPGTVVRSQPLPLSNGRIQEDPDLEDEDVTVDETIELDDTVHDPTWRPVQAIQNRETLEIIRIHRETARGTT